LQNDRIPLGCSRIRREVQGFLSSSVLLEFVAILGESAQMRTIGPHFYGDVLPRRIFFCSASRGLASSAVLARFFLPLRVFSSRTTQVTWSRWCRRLKKLARKCVTLANLFRIVRRASSRSAICGFSHTRTVISIVRQTSSDTFFFRLSFGPSASADFLMFSEISQTELSFLSRYNGERGETNDRTYECVEIQT